MTDPTAGPENPPHPWALDLVAVLRQHLEPDFHVTAHPMIDGDAEVFVSSTKYAEPHGRVLLIEDDDAEKTRDLSILLGVQGIGGGEIEDFAADLYGAGRLADRIRHYFKAVDFIRADAIEKAAKLLDPPESPPLPCDCDWSGACDAHNDEAGVRTKWAAKIRSLKQPIETTSH